MLGEGGFGNVFKGKWGKHLEVAIKAINIFAYGNAKETKKMVLGEIRFLVTIHHVNIVNLQAICMEDKKVYLITEFCKGSTLHSVIHDAEVKKEFCLTHKKIFKICEDLCNGVTYIHENNILHRDIKPINIIIDKNLN